MSTNMKLCDSNGKINVIEDHNNNVSLCKNLDIFVSCMFALIERS